MCDNILNLKYNTLKIGTGEASISRAGNDDNDASMTGSPGSRNKRSRSFPSRKKPPKEYGIVAMVKTYSDLVSKKAVDERYNTPIQVNDNTRLKIEQQLLSEIL